MENYIKNKAIIINIEKENFDYLPTTNIKDYKFSTMGGDIQIRQLVDEIVEGDIETPPIQRQYVWTPLLASRFIESALLDLPLPSIFLCKQKNGKYLIIDGLQRLTSLKLFLKGENYNGKIFKIINSNSIYKEWKGKTFCELSDDDQRRLKNKTIHAIIVEQQNPDNYEGLFLIFERINSGGLQLNQQEIRNAIFHGSYNDMLLEINENILWREFFGDSRPHKRMKDVEMILRFFSLRKLELSENSIGTLSFVTELNKHMVHYKDSKYLDGEKQAFLQNLEIIKKNFGTGVFRSCIFNENLKITKKFYASVFDAIMISTDYCVQRKYNTFSDNDKLIKLFLNEDFKNFINSHTSDKKSVYGRIKQACFILYGIKYDK